MKICSILSKSWFSLTVKLRFVFVVLFFFLSLPPAVGALSITLAWDPNPAEENVVGYRLYYGTENDLYAYMIDVRNTLLKKVSGIKKGQSYYFIITAYNEYGLESGFSEPLGVSSCTFKVSPGRKTFKDIGGNGYVNVKTQPDCTWSATSGVSWLTIIDGESGVGPGIITYSVEPNDSSEPRSSISALSISQVDWLNPFVGKPFRIKQKGKK